MNRPLFCCSRSPPAPSPLVSSASQLIRLQLQLAADQVTDIHVTLPHQQASAPLSSANLTLIRTLVARSHHATKPRRDTMERRLSAASRRSAPSPIQQLSHLAQRVGAVNLAEGFPDFPAPANVKAAATAAIAADLNQYRHVQGICDVLAETARRDHGLDVDPLTDIVICCGQSEAFAAAIFAIIDQGDEVLVFDPAYETYETCIELARGVPVYVPLDPPSWTLNEDKFLKSFTSRTKAVILNSPHNPTGKVFSKEELLIIAQACQKMDCFAITDEVYEYITYDENKHISVASLPGMQERTIITSSLSKTYSVTGWRIGWACAPASIASAIRNIHIKLTDSAPAPFQEAALTALTSTPDFYSSLKKDYEVRRDFILQLLKDFGFHISFRPQGSVFVFAELPRSWQLSDIEFVTNLINDAGVAAVPGRGFFHRNCDGESYHHQYVRFAFCKGDDTLMAAALRMRKLADSKGTWLTGSSRQEDQTSSASPWCGSV